MGRSRLPLSLWSSKLRKETIHSPPSVKGERKRLIDDIVDLAANKFEDLGQPQGPIYDQPLRLVWYELEIDGSTN